MSTLTQVQIDKLIERELKNREYRKQYNQRTDVKIKRKQYMKNRYETMKMMVEEYKKLVK